MARRAKAPVAGDEEALPEADRLAGFPHPRETQSLFGQEAAEAGLLEAWHSGRMHHAWLLTGPEGVGKATLAYRFARFALAGGASAGPGLAVDPEHPAARQVAALSHPSLLVIRRPWNFQTKRLATVITVEEVRKLRAFLGHTAEAGSYRVVIVDRADELNSNAANALLKSLEEPPVRTVFFLISAEAGRLLPTIHSRCRRLQLAALASGDLAAAMVEPMAAAGQTPPTGDRLDLLAGLSGGSVRRALVLASGGGLELYGRLIGILAGLPRLDREAVHRLAEDLGAATREQDFLTFYTLLEEVLGRLVRHAATGSGGLGEEAELAPRLIGTRGLATWAELWETIARAKALTLALNLDRKTLILETLLNIGAACRGTD